MKGHIGKYLPGVLFIMYAAQNGSVKRLNLSIEYFFSLEPFVLLSKVLLNL